MQRLIGITGKAGAGKDTLATQLIIFFGGECQRMAFAWPLKRMIDAMQGIPTGDGRPNDRWEDQKFKEQVISRIGRSPRYLAQTLGTEWGRQLVNDNLWVNLTLEAALAAEGTVIITDVRFDNEAKAVRDAGGAILRIVRPDLVEIKEGSHVSEAGVSDHLVAATLWNDSDIITLKKRAIAVVTGLGFQPD